MSLDMDSRVVKPKVPLRLVIGAILITIVVVGVVVFGVYESGSGLRDARLSGIVAAKEFNPSPAPEAQITLGRDGSLAARTVDGEYTITVEVEQPDGTTKPFRVWLDKARYENVKVGDTFDVGPYLVE